MMRKGATEIERRWYFAKRASFAIICITLATWFWRNFTYPRRTEYNVPARKKFIHSFNPILCIIQDSHKVFYNLICCCCCFIVYFTCNFIPLNWLFSICQMFYVRDLLVMRGSLVEHCFFSPSKINSDISLSTRNVFN